MQSKEFRVCVCVEVRWVWASASAVSVCGVVGKGKSGVAMAMLTHEWHHRRFPSGWGCSNGGEGGECLCV